MINNNMPATNMGNRKAFATSVFPSCQNPRLAARNINPARMKNLEEKISSLAHSVANFNISMGLIHFIFFSVLRRA